MFENSKISYREHYLGEGDSCVYRQKMTLTKEEFGFIQTKIKERLAQGLEYGNHLQRINLNDFGFARTNLSTARFIKSLLPEKLQKRFLMDRNTCLEVRK